MFHLSRVLVRAPVPASAVCGLVCRCDWVGVGVCEHDFRGRVDRLTTRKTKKPRIPVTMYRYVQSCTAIHKLSIDNAFINLYTAIVLREENMEDTEPKRVIAYLRVSTDAQAGDDKFGLEAQREMIAEYCKSHNMIIDHEVPDEGQSGAKRREKFELIVQTEHNPPIAGVVIAKSDRLARDINIYYYYKMLLRNANMELWSVTEDFGALGAFAPMLESFTMCVAQMERMNITQRTSGGRHIKAGTGGYSGGNAPFGYKLVNGKLVINPEEAKIVKRIFTLRDDKHYTLQQITDALMESGAVNRKGTRFYPSSIRSILMNRKTYEGYYHYKGYNNGEWVRGQQEPILVETRTDDNGDPDSDKSDI